MDRVTAYKKTKKGAKPSNKRVTAIDRTEQKLKILQDVSGAATGVWREDAQEYINKLRRE